MEAGCICCANGNDLPDGACCHACGRVGTVTGLRAAVIKARGRTVPPTFPIQFDGTPEPRLYVDTSYGLMFGIPMGEHRLVTPDEMAALTKAFIAIDAATKSTS